MLTAASTTQKRIGTLPKDNEKVKGGFGAPLSEALKAANLEILDVSAGFGQLLAAKDEVRFRLFVLCVLSNLVACAHSKRLRS